ncbi:hypothetical protein IKG06_03880 [Candidatus Saccharibacteria bacterium]|nr:hypothetical protein [Candidatus Saccharibacteria bacterium]
MVHQPTESGEINKPSKSSKIRSILLDTLVMILVAIATFAFLRLTIIKPENREVNNPSVIKTIPAGNGDSNSQD